MEIHRCIFKILLIIIVIFYSFGIPSIVKGEGLVVATRPEVRIVPSDTKTDEIDAYITWTTNEKTKGEVVYGLTPEYGLKEFEMTSFFYPNINHRVIIKSLERGKKYHFRVLDSDLNGNTHKSEEYTFIAELPKYGGSSATKEFVTLFVQDNSGLSRVSEPARGGIPLPEGKIRSLDNMRIVDLEGNEVLAQFQDLARWPDGSIKWVLVQFQCDLNSRERGEYRLEYGTEVKRQAQYVSELVVKEDEESIYIQTGAMSFSIAKEEPKILEGLMMGNTSLLDSNIDFVITDMDGKKHSISQSKFEEIVLEEDGPLRAVIRFKGQHTDDENNKFFQYLVRMYVYSGRPEVRFSYTFMNNCEKVVPVHGLYGNYVKGIDLVVPLKQVNGLEYSLPGDRNIYSGKVQSHDEKVEVLQSFPKEYVITSGEKKIGSGKANEGWIYVGPQDKGYGVLAHIDNFWETYPKGFSISKDTLSISVAPGIKTDRYGMKDVPAIDYWKNEITAKYWYLRDDAYFIPQGVANTTGIVLRFYEAASSVEDYRETSRRYGDQLQIYTEPKWYADTQAFGKIVTAEDNPFQGYEKVVEKGFSNLKDRRERFEEYGMLNFGDWNFWENNKDKQWGNIEYDLAYGLFLYFARTGGHQYFTRAEEAAIHFRDVDVIHYSNQPRRYSSPQYATNISMPGEVRTHAFAHSGYGESNMHGHAWLRGLVLHYYLTGDRYSLDVAKSIGDVFSSYSINSLLDDWMIRFASQRTPGERNLSWPIYGLTELYKATGDQYYFNAANIFVDKFLTKQHEDGSWKKPLLRPGHCYHKDPLPACQGNAGFEIALSLSALAEYWELTGDDRIPDSIVRAADWLLNDLWSPLTATFRYTSCDLTNYAPNLNCLYLHGLAYAYRFSGEERFMKAAMQALAVVEKTPATRGKEFAMCLMTAPHFLYDASIYYDKTKGEKDKGVGLLRFLRK